MILKSQYPKYIGEASILIFRLNGLLNYDLDPNYADNHHWPATVRADRRFDITLGSYVTGLHFV
jgi:hypothetical protein